MFTKGRPLLYLVGMRSSSQCYRGPVQFKMKLAKMMELTAQDVTIYWDTGLCDYRSRINYNAGFAAVVRIIPTLK